MCQWLYYMNGINLFTPHTQRYCSYLYTDVSTVFHVLNVSIFRTCYVALKGEISQGIKVLHNTQPGTILSSLCRHRGPFARPPLHDTSIHISSYDNPPVRQPRQHQQLPHKENSMVKSSPCTCRMGPQSCQQEVWNPCQSPAIDNSPSVVMLIACTDSGSSADHLHQYNRPAGSSTLALNPPLPTAVALLSPLNIPKSTTQSQLVFTPASPSHQAESSPFSMTPTTSLPVRPPTPGKHIKSADHTVWPSVTPTYPWHLGVPI